MELFNKLEERGIPLSLSIILLDIVVSSTKLIKGMLEEDVRGVRISDKASECLINEESENWDVFTPDDRKEFLFRIFMHLKLGGSMCQPDERITPYLEATKIVYKNLVK